MEYLNSVNPISNQSTLSYFSFDENVQDQRSLDLLEKHINIVNELLSQSPKNTNDCSLVIRHVSEMCNMLPSKYYSNVAYSIVNESKEVDSLVDLLFKKASDHLVKYGLSVDLELLFFNVLFCVHNSENSTLKIVDPKEFRLKFNGKLSEFVAQHFNDKLSFGYHFEKLYKLFNEETLKLITDANFQQNKLKLVESFDLTSENGLLPFGDFQFKINTELRKVPSDVFVKSMRNTFLNMEVDKVTSFGVLSQEERSFIVNRSLLYA